MSLNQNDINKLLVNCKKINDNEIKLNMYPKYIRDKIFLKNTDCLNLEAYVNKHNNIYENFTNIHSKYNFNVLIVIICVIIFLFAKYFIII